MGNLIQNDFQDVLTKIRSARQKAYAQVNETLLQLYWDIGKFISFKVKAENWGENVVTQLADFIKQSDPGIKGFSSRNIWRMKQFYEVYQNNEKLSTLWSQLSWSHNQTKNNDKILNEKLATLWRQLRRDCNQAKSNDETLSKIKKRN